MIFLKKFAKKRKLSNIYYNKLHVRLFRDITITKYSNNLGVFADSLLFWSVC